MNASISKSLRVKLLSGSTCNEDHKHEIDSQPLRILSKSEAIVDSSVDTAHTSVATTDQTHDLPSLVWKYFADEIREALIQVQQSIGGIDRDQD
jgi:hypothetical protein